MRKYMCTHSFPPGSLTREKITELGRAGQQDPNVRGYRSFINLSDGKVCCVLEANRREDVAGWFQKMGVPYESISEVELEGERGKIQDLKEEPALAGMP